jgi:hypothetical protein
MKAYGVHSRDRGLQKNERHVGEQKDFVEALGILPAPIGSLFHQLGIQAFGYDADDGQRKDPESDADPAACPSERASTKEETSNRPQKGEDNLHHPLGCTGARFRH